jgi:hypothetical protein
MPRAVAAAMAGSSSGGAAAAAVAVGMDEEVEDADGNVYSRKVYEDLKRQGLV